MSAICDSSRIPASKVAQLCKVMGPEGTKKKIMDGAKDDGRLEEKEMKEVATKETATVDDSTEQRGTERKHKGKKY